MVLHYKAIIEIVQPFEFKDLVSAEDFDYRMKHIDKDFETALKENLKHFFDDNATIDVERLSFELSTNKY